MQVKRFVGHVVGLLVVLFGCVVLVSCASGPPANVQSVTCKADKISWEVIPEAEIVGFACEPGRHEGEDSIIFTVDVKNSSRQPQRFRLSIFLPAMDKAMGSLIPTKGTPPVLAPGAAEKVKLPFMKTTQLPEKIEVRVSAISVEE